MNLNELSLCNEHLTQLYAAIERGDIQRVRHLTHVLTTTEECVACAYALKAHGQVQVELKRFLKNEGFAVEVPAAAGVIASVSFFLVRLIVLAVLFMAIMFFGSLFKSFLGQTRAGFQFGSFGWVGIFLLTLASFVFVEYEFFE